MNKREQTYRSEEKSPNKDSEEANMNSDSDFDEFHTVKRCFAEEEINEIINEKAKKDNIKSSEILLSIPTRVGSKNNILFLALTYTCSSDSISNTKLIGPCSEKKVSSVDTSRKAEAIVDNVKFPQFTLKNALE